MSISQAEKQKYEEVWALPDYSNMSPGEQYAEKFGEICNPLSGESVIDWGSGRGAGGIALNALYGLRSAYVDHVALEGTPDTLIISLWDKKAGMLRADYSYCCDVMEHIPPQFTMLVAARIIQCAKKGAFFSISFAPDFFGKFVGAPLHLTVKPFTWWRDSLRELGTVVHAIDLMGEGLFYVER